MPRPKRTKVASATTRVAKTSTTADPAPRKQQPKAKQTKEPEVVNNSFSEDSDGLVVKSHTTRPRRRMPWQKTPEPVDEAEMTMTGALPVEDKVTVASNKIQTPGSSMSKRRRTSKGSARESSKKSTPATVASTRSRSFATNVQNTPAEEDDSTGFDGLLTFDSLDSESPAHGTRPPSAIKVGATPAHETSILALTNFKRRARQPSLLRMVHQTTDVEDNDQDDSHDLSLNLDLSDELDDFHPDAESTPLNVRKNAQEPETNKHGRDSLSSTASRGTKRKLSPVIQVPRSSPPFDPPSGTDLEASRSPSPSLPEVLESREVPEETVEQSEGEPDILSETLAPPRSSSSERETDDLPDSPVQMQPRRRARSTRQATRDEESETEETETPAKPKGRTKKKAGRSISTTQLKNLLPRRRTRKQQGQNDSDVESEEDMTVDSDQDELQLPPPRRRVASRKPVPTKVTKKSTRGQKKSATVTKAAQKNPKTYSRRTSSDKENEGANYSDEDVQETTESTVNSTIAVKPLKMAAIAKKFQDVDEFELEFETVDITTSSSPWR